MTDLPRVFQLSDMVSLASATKERRRHRQSSRLYALVSDLATIAICFAVTGFIRWGDPIHEHVARMFLVIAPLFVVFAATGEGYALRIVAEPRAGSYAVFRAFAFAMSTLGVVVFFLRANTDLSRSLFGAGAVLALISLPVSRYILAISLRNRLGGRTWTEVIISDGVSLEKAQGAYILEIPEDLTPQDFDHPSALDQLGRCLEYADRVVIACPADDRAGWAHVMKGIDIAAEVAAPEITELGAIALSRYVSQSTLVISAGPLTLRDRTIKRLFDLVIVIASGPIIAIVMLVVAIAIKIDSRGPVFFRQDRVGQGNRSFVMYKFRSMYTDRGDAVADQLTQRGGDARVTKVGRFIRGSSLDEVPQILNVLRGEMSIVGPRPHAIGARAANRLYWDIDERYWHRHAVRPGLTGLAQIRGFRGTTELETDLTDRLQADLEYVADWSLWRDIAIMLATVRVFSHRNAF